MLLHSASNAGRGLHDGSGSRRASTSTGYEASLLFSVDATDPLVKSFAHASISWLDATLEGLNLDRVGAKPPVGISA